MTVLPPLTIARAPQLYIVAVRGCDDSSVVFASKRTADEAVALQALIERGGQGHGCQPSVEVFAVRDLDLTSEWTDDHATLCRAYRRAGLLTEDEDEQYL